MYTVQRSMHVQHCTLGKETRTNLKAHARKKAHGIYIYPTKAVFGTTQII